jgi:peroxiredoxin
MNTFPFWTKNLLRVAGIYNVIWGSWVVLFPNSFFYWFDLSLPIYPMIWQSVGMIVGVYGIGYYVAAENPQRHWPIIFVGWLGKLFGPIGAIYYLLIGKLTPWFLLHNLTNDIIWLPFFTIIIYNIIKNGQNTSKNSGPTLEDALSKFTVLDGSSLAQLNKKKPIMLLFLRHFGCTFCRETLQNLKHNYLSISQHCEVVIVHMSEEKVANQYFETYGLTNVKHVSDRDCELYEAFSLYRGNFNQLFGPKVWIRGFIAGIIKGNGIGKLQGDGFRMPGVFILQNNKIIDSYYYSSAADRPVLLKMAENLKMKSIELEV